jgi:polar amino acid transport system substrate-binding protein
VRVSDVPPQYIQQDGQWTGRAVELMEVLLREANCRAEYVKSPWKRALIELEQGRIDAMMNVGYDKQRADSYYFVSPNAYETTVLLMRKDTEIDINSLSDLKKLPLKIGYETGNLFDKDFTDMFEEDLEFRSSFKALAVGDMTEMVFLGRLSGELTILENAQHSIASNPKYQEHLKVHPMIISKLPSFFAFSKHSISKDKIIELQAANIRAISKELYQEVIERWQ